MENQDPAPAGACADMAHELKQPLTAIMGYAELLKRKLAEGTTEHRYAENIFRESERLLEMIKGLNERLRAAEGRPRILP
ncbi:MAG: histidine kinase dimerization/phospho-acceptor domain-containing protein [Myxococcota bacterium]